MASEIRCHVESHVAIEEESCLHTKWLDHVLILRQGPWPVALLPPADRLQEWHLSILPSTTFECTRFPTNHARCTFGTESAHLSLQITAFCMIWKTKWYYFLRMGLWLNKLGIIYTGRPPLHYTECPSKGYQDRTSIIKILLDHDCRTCF